MHSTRKRADQLQAGDRIDIYGDTIADPDRNYWRHPVFGPWVSSAKPEGQYIVVELDNGDTIGFPPGHMVRAVG